MSFTVFLGNLPIWVTADDIKGWLSAETLVADAIKVIRNPETQESKGFAFIDAPNTEEMNAIIRRFDRAPLEDRLLRANPAQPPKPKGPVRPGSGPGAGGFGPGGASHSGPRDAGHSTSHSAGHTSGYSSGASTTASSPQGSSQPTSTPVVDQRPPRRHKKSATKRPPGGPQSAFAEELSKAL